MTSNSDLAVYRRICLSFGHRRQLGARTSNNRIGYETASIQLVNPGQYAKAGSFRVEMDERDARLSISQRRHAGTGEDACLHRGYLFPYDVAFETANG